MPPTTGPKITKEAFIKGYCERSKVDWETLQRLGQIAIPCDCEDELCEGWQMIDKGLSERLSGANRE